MVKDLVVNLSVGADRDIAAGYAISIAEAFEAHIAGVAFASDPVITPTVMDGLSATWIDEQRAESRGLAQAAIDAFEHTAKNAGLSAEHRLIEASIGSAAALFGRIARRFDLSVVSQRDPDRNTPDDLFIESALLESGRPVVVVPYIQRGGLKLDRVLVCWDTRRNAARAVADALPFLHRSKTVEVISISKSGGPEDDLPGADIAQHLARHGLTVDAKHLVGADIDVADMILSYAADCGADFIVMGGYGHSRLREFVLGGATKGILDAMTVPVLMSH
jgi:nucleotide-binding universal stress UspA family protein